MGNYVASHIVGRNAYHFINDYGKISHNTTLDVVGDFQLGFQIKPDDYRPDGVLFSKNDSSGVYLAPNITIHTYMTNYYFYVEISDGTNKLAYKTDDPIFLSYKPVQLDIQWKQSTKTMLIKKDGVATAFTIYVPNSNYYSLASSFGTAINILPNADMFFAYSIGLTAFRGIFYGGMFINAYVSDDDIYTYYQSVKDAVTIAPTDYILFASNKPLTSYYSLYSMTGKGESQALKLSGGGNVSSPQSSADGSLLCFLDSSDGYIYNTNGTFGAITKVVYGNQPSISPDKTKVIFLNNNQIYTIDSNALNSNQHDIFTDLGTFYYSNPNISKVTIDGNYKFLCLAHSNSNGVNSLLTTNYSNLMITNLASSNILLNIGYHDAFSRPDFSKDGTKIGVSIRYSSLGKFNIYYMNSTGGGLTQVTTSSVKDSYFISFSPDGNRILFSDSNNDLWTCTLDGGLMQKLNIDTYPCNSASWVYN